MVNIEDFCDKHQACDDGREWALESCKTMQDVWDTAQPEWLIWVATQRGVLSDRELRLFAAFCARTVEHLMTDQRSRDAIDTAERFAHGQATSEELAAAWAAARSAASDVTWAAARSAAEDVTWDAARDAARSAAWAAADAADAARDAARSAARDAARSAARAAASDAAWDAADAARDAARSAARDAARSAASDAAWDAASDAAWDAAWAAARSAASDAHARWLRENAKPNFEIGGATTTAETD